MTSLILLLRGGKFVRGLFCFSFYSALAENTLKGHWKSWPTVVTHIKGPKKYIFFSISFSLRVRGRTRTNEKNLPKLEISAFLSFTALFLLAWSGRGLVEQNWRHILLWSRLALFFNVKLLINKCWTFAYYKLMRTDHRALFGVGQWTLSGINQMSLSHIKHSFFVHVIIK